MTKLRVVYKGTWGRALVGLGDRARREPTRSWRRRGAAFSRASRPRSTTELAPTAASVADLVAALTERYPERAVVERQVFVRTSIIDDLAGEWTQVFFVDPDPHSGPEASLWMVAWTDAWTE